MELCEVRIPTYKRPKLLKRALDSLIKQDYSHWVALVMDDSPSQEANLIVQSFNDKRIRYKPNFQNFGCAENISQAFASQSLSDGLYACILEDDNWLMPNFISENIKSLKNHNVNIILRNQVIWQQSQDQSTPTNRTTRGMWFTEKIYTPFELQAHLFYFEGISNGGLFWRTSVQSNLQVSRYVLDSGLQEYCRTLQIQDDFYFESKPLCYWSEMPYTLSLRNAVNNRIFGRGLQSIKRHLLKIYGQSIVQEAAQVALRLNKQTEFEISLLDSLYTNYGFRQLDIKLRIQQYITSYAKFKFIPDPLNLYFAKT